MLSVLGSLLRSSTRMYVSAEKLLYTSDKKLFEPEYKYLEGFRLNLKEVFKSTVGKNWSVGTFSLI
jgi:hypothetical protein